MKVVDIKKVLFRTQPYTAFNWRFLCAHKGSPEYLQRFAFLYQNKKLSLPVRFAMGVFVYGKWYLYRALVSCIQVYRNCSKKEKDKPIKQRIKLFAGLLRLSYGYAIPPENYFILVAQKTPVTRWLHYVFDFQASNWHTAFTDFNDPEQVANIQLLSDKYLMEQKLRAAGLQTVVTFRKLDEGETLKNEEVGTLPELFFCKPNNLNQGRGCWQVERTQKKSEKDEPTFVLKSAEKNLVWSEVDSTTLNTVLTNRYYLLQNMLANSRALTKIAGEELVDMRCVTYCQGGNIWVYSSYILLPHKEQDGVYLLCHIDPQTGACTLPGKPGKVRENYMKKCQPELSKLMVGQWNTIKGLCFAAHDMVRSSHSVAWDLSITEQGPMLIEGNSHWGPEIQQVVEERPLLAGEELDCYNHLIDKLIHSR